MIRFVEDSGFGRFPSRLFAINQAWLELALTGIDLPAWSLGHQPAQMRRTIQMPVRSMLQPGQGQAKPVPDRRRTRNGPFAIRGPTGGQPGLGVALHRPADRERRRNTDPTCRRVCGACTSNGNRNTDTDTGPS